MGELWTSGRDVSFGWKRNKIERMLVTELSSVRIRPETKESMI